ncbi:lysozyme inhibitor LprI family protein [Paraburkholderia panacisoli]|uniref:lysozyme inhibitor LprI family protein n=1 Tax=Paraburkholderia panacisoli TaxID=2603818 RepID=UPI00165F4B6E|nr:lysozyme inhibitor LprI family protein [Paraburkholderia panacisoli]
MSTALVATAYAETEAQFVQSAAGVWRSDGGSLLTIGPISNGLIGAIDSTGTSFVAQSSKFNEDQSYLTLKIVSAAAPMTWVLREVWNADHTRFSLTLTANSGMKMAFSYVRDLEDEDHAALAKLASRRAPSVAAAPALQPAPHRVAVAANADPCSDNASDAPAMLECLEGQREQADKALNAAYKTTMARLDDGGKQRLKLDERAWIKQRDKTCEENDSGLNAGSRAVEASVECFADETRKRTAIVQTFK